MVDEDVFDCALRDAASAQVVLRGELDADSAERVDAVLSEALERTTGDLVVDVTDLTFISACGLGALAVTAHRLGARGRMVRLVGATPLLQRLLTITELDRHVLVDPPPTDQDPPGTS